VCASEQEGEGFRGEERDTIPSSALGGGAEGTMERANKAVRNFMDLLSTEDKQEACLLDYVPGEE